MIDLHGHTTASDGVLEPAAYVRLAAEAGVRVIAVTDHDTTAGVAEALEAARRIGEIRVVPGIEISARLGSREIHLLGHFVDHLDPALQARLVSFGDARARRMEAMVERCREVGLDVRLEEIEAQGAMGRPHLARLLVKKGYARDLQNAFDRWIGVGGPAWVERPLPSAKEALAAIHAAGGCATVAHPALSGLGEADLRELAAMGLDGVEVDHPKQTRDQRRKLRAAAAELGLCATAGTDFHAPGHLATAPGLEGMDADAFARYEARRSDASARV